MVCRLCSRNRHIARQVQQVCSAQCRSGSQCIYAGLIKFVAGGKDAFMVKYNSMNQRGKYVPPSLDEPCPTIATQQRLALASVSFLSKQFSGQPDSKNVSVEEPAGTITTIDHHAFVKAQFIVNYRFNNTGHSIEDPAQTICTVGQIGVASCSFIANEYSVSFQASNSPTRLC